MIGDMDLYRAGRWVAVLVRRTVIPACALTAAGLIMWRTGPCVVHAVSLPIVLLGFLLLVASLASLAAFWQKWRAWAIEVIAASLAAAGIGYPLVLPCKPLVWTAKVDGRPAELFSAHHPALVPCDFEVSGTVDLGLKAYLIGRRAGERFFTVFPTGGSGFAPDWIGQVRGLETCDGKASFELLAIAVDKEDLPPGPLTVLPQRLAESNLVHVVPGARKPPRPDAGRIRITDFVLGGEPRQRQSVVSARTVFATARVDGNVENVRIDWDNGEEARVFVPVSGEVFSAMNTYAKAGTKRVVISASGANDQAVEVSSQITIQPTEDE